MAYTYSITSPIDLRLPVQPDTDDPVLFGELQKVYNALRNLELATTDLTGAITRDASTWSSLGVTDTLKSQNLNRVYLKAGEPIAYGAVINVYDMGGAVPGIRNANASSATPRPAFGYCVTPGGVLTGAYGEFILMSGLCVAIAGLTVGSTYYLSTTPGIITNVKPIAPNLQQPLGFALGTQSFYFSPVLL